MKNDNLGFYLTFALLGLASQASAQSVSDLQGVTPPQPTPSHAAALPKIESRPAEPSATVGGQTVALQSVEISGNKAIESAILLGQLGDIKGRRLDMAGLTALSDQLGIYYRASGYPFAQVYLPPQSLKDGKLEINVIEGSYGVVSAAGLHNLPASAQPFLNYGLESGDPILNSKLERTLLILDDQPGIKVKPVLKPGAQQGQADLIVNVERSSDVKAELGLDNTGARSTGQYRTRASLYVNSPFLFGDRISLNGLYTSEAMWLGSLDYEMPLGSSGLRGQIGYAHTSYQLAGAFTALDAKGLANVTTAKLSYPVVRSQATNVLLSVGLQHKDLEDHFGTGDITRKKSSNGVPLGLQFDKRDTLLGGGVSYGSLSWLSGQLRLDAAMMATDATTAATQGRFNKVTLDVARIQKIAGDLSFYGRYSGQWANKNLDSSEKFNLGGYYGVRAYPVGEGAGDKGWLTQLELRYSIDGATPFFFYDFGQTNINARPWVLNSTQN